MREPFDKEATLKEIESVVANDMFEGEGGNLKNNVRILLAALYVGKNADKIARFLGLNRDTFVRPRVRRLRQCGIFGADGMIHADWFEDHGLLALLMDSMVAEGLVRRTDDTFPDSGAMKVVDQPKEPDAESLPVAGGTNDRVLVAVPRPLM